MAIGTAATIGLGLTAAGAIGNWLGGDDDSGGGGGSVSASLQANAQAAQQLQGMSFSNPFSNLSNSYAGMSNPYAGLQNEYAGLTNTMSGLESQYSGLTNQYAGLTNQYSGLQNTMSGLQNTMSGLTNQYEGLENTMAGLQNPLANLSNQYAGMENTMEDLTVNQLQAEFEAQQNQQSQANILESLRESAGGSGIAGLAQAMAREGQLASQQASASIGMQESDNQRLAAQEAGRIQELQMGEQSRLDTIAAQQAVANMMAEAQQATALQMAGAQQAGDIQMAQAQQAGDIQMSQAEMANALQMAQAAGATDLQIAQAAGATDLQMAQAQDASALQLAQAQLANQLQLAQAEGATNLGMAQAGAGMDINMANAANLMNIQQLQGQGSQFQQQMLMDQQIALMQNALGQGTLNVQASVAGEDTGGGSIWDVIGGIGQTTLGLSSWGSDRKLKKNITLVGKSPKGINIYTFEYKNKDWGVGLFQGVMSDEVPKSAVIKSYVSGYDFVDYSKLDVEFKSI
jgi:archaellum component FlaC